MHASTFPDTFRPFQKTLLNALGTVEKWSGAEEGNFWTPHLTKVDSCVHQCD